MTGLYVDTAKECQHDPFLKILKRYLKQTLKQVRKYLSR